VRAPERNTAQVTTAPHALASRLSVVKPSATNRLHQKTLDLRARGVAILGFGVGEPDFDTPLHIVEAAQRALANGATRYTSVRGIEALRVAICDDSATRRGGVVHRPEEVLVSVGAKHSLFNLCFALLEAGDEALIPAPCWVSYPEQCALAGATPVIVPTRQEEGFKLTPEALRSALTPRTKALFLCTPSNPTGSAYSAQDLTALAEVLRNHHCYVVVDEIYGTLVYGGFAQHSLLDVAPDLRDRIIVVDGVSKRFAMTGFRIGWMLGPKAIVDACEVIQSQTTSSPASVSQHAALAALRGDQAPVETMRAAFERRRALVVAGINAIPGLSCREPEGAFYAFFDVATYLGRTLGGTHIADDNALAEYLLEHAQAAFVPGSAFCAPGHLRMSFAASEEDITLGIAHLAAALSR
jgi:aspartate aminotransferase